MFFFLICNKNGAGKLRFPYWYELWMFKGDVIYFIFHYFSCTYYLFTLVFVEYFSIIWFGDGYFLWRCSWHQLIHCRMNIYIIHRSKWELSKVRVILGFGSFGILWSAIIVPIMPGLCLLRCVLELLKPLNNLNSLEFFYVPVTVSYLYCKIVFCP